MFSKYATPKYKEQFKASFFDYFKSEVIEDAIIQPYDAVRKIFEKKVPVTDIEFRQMIADAKQEAFSIAGIKSTAILQEVQSHRC